MPLFEVKVPLGPVAAHSQQERILLNTAFRLDQRGEGDTGCLFGIFDGQAVMYVTLDCYDADSAKINALYAVRDELQNTAFETLLDPATYDTLECKPAK